MIDEIEMPNMEIVGSVISEVLDEAFKVHKDHGKDENHKCEMCKFQDHLQVVTVRSPEDIEKLNELDKSIFKFLQTVPGTGIVGLMGGLDDLRYLGILCFWFGYRTAIAMDRTKKLNEMFKES